MFRDTLRPVRMGRVSDSGPLLPAPQGATAEQFPSLPIQNKLRERWGLDGPCGLFTELFASHPGNGDAQNLSAVTALLTRS